MENSKVVEKGHGPEPFHDFECYLKSFKCTCFNCSRMTYCWFDFHLYSFYSTTTVLVHVKVEKIIP
jgi:hypothetical protein